jgi:hypothetical protein
MSPSTIQQWENATSNHVTQYWNSKLPSNPVAVQSVRTTFTHVQSVAAYAASRIQYNQTVVYRVTNDTAWQSTLSTFVFDHSLFLAPFQTGNQQAYELQLSALFNQTTVVVQSVVALNSTTTHHSTPPSPTGLPRSTLVALIVTVIGMLLCLFIATCQCE